MFSVLGKRFLQHAKDFKSRALSLTINTFTKFFVRNLLFLAHKFKGLPSIQNFNDEILQYRKSAVSEVQADVGNGIF